MPKYVQLTQDKGNLVVTLLPEGREFILDAENDPEQNIHSEAFLRDLFEDNTCNGWEWIRPEEIGALTDGPIISDDVIRDDHGNLTGLGRVFWHERYALESIPEILLRDGRIVIRGYD